MTQKNSNTKKASNDTEELPAVPREVFDGLLDEIIGDVDLPSDDAESWDNLIAEGKHPKSISLGSAHKKALLKILGVEPGEMDENHTLRAKYLKKLEKERPYFNENQRRKLAYRRFPIVGSKIPSAAEIINMILDHTELEGRL